MANKKKRNKKYSGVDAVAHTTVVKVSAIKRSPVKQYWFDNKAKVRPIGIGLLVVFGVILIVTGLISAFAGAR